MLITVQGYGAAHGQTMLIVNDEYELPHDES